MTRDEAQLYFHENEDINEKYETLLFECKQLLISRLPTTKLFNAALKRMHLNSQAYIVLGGQEVNFTPRTEKINRYSSNQVSETVTEFYLESNRLKLLLFNSNSFVELKYNCNQLILNLKEFALKWVISLEGIEVGDVKISTIPNPMNVLSAVELFNQEGFNYFNEININEHFN